MGFQKINNLHVYVVDLKEIPPLPIRGHTDEEAAYKALLNLFGGPGLLLLGGGAWYEMSGRYARALTASIESGLITTPGRYAIHLSGDNYQTFRVSFECGDCLQDAHCQGTTGGCNCDTCGTMEDWMRAASRTTPT